jgi:hypothetical protein
MLVDDGQASIDASIQASVQMETVPDSPPIASSVTMSLWQLNCRYQGRAIASLAKRRSPAVALTAAKHQRQSSDYSGTSGVAPAHHPAPYFHTGEFMKLIALRESITPARPTPCWRRIRRQRYRRTHFDWRENVSANVIVQRMRPAAVEAPTWQVQRQKKQSLTTAPNDPHRLINRPPPRRCAAT